ncbi:MAG: hypothetical protein H0W50_10050 [Parachlamydiaceae bacterium]|nr:hypothetical protein [Parachlamydiaceae bacterium]
MLKKRKKTQSDKPGGMARIRWMRQKGNLPLRTRLKNQIEETRKLQIELLQNTFLEDELSTIKISKGNL